MEKDELVAYWVETANKDYQTMKHLYDSGDYHWALFVGHLIIEKLLKAHFVQVNNTQPSFSHNLLKLAEMANVELDEGQEDLLDLITSFNIRARYPDYKLDFYQKCTKKYAEEQIRNIEELRKWLIQKLQTSS